MFDIEKLIKTQIEIDQIEQSIEFDLSKLSLKDQIDFLAKHIRYLERAKSIFQHQNTISFLLNKLDKLKELFQTIKHHPRNVLPERRLKRKPKWLRVGGRLKRL